MDPELPKVLNAAASNAKNLAADLENFIAFATTLKADLASASTSLLATHAVVMAAPVEATEHTPAVNVKAVAAPHLVEPPPPVKSAETFPNPNVKK